MEKTMDEKTIREMARDCCNTHCDCEKCVSLHGDIYWQKVEDCQTYRVLKRVAEKGYRKESDTAKEICDKVIGLYRQVMPLQKKGLFIAENAFICGITEIEKTFAEDKE